MSTPFLFLLEDDRERIERFQTIVRVHHPNARLDIYRSAPEFVIAYQELAHIPDLIGLDHDLFTDSPNDPDPGDGRDVACFLMTQEPISPILIHSTNSFAADSMLFSLRDAGWKTRRITPLGDDWIEADWFPVITTMISNS